MTHHTPGPWHIIFNNNDVEDEILGADGEHVASAYTTITQDLRERYANARLISAAPQMLEALRQALSALYELEVQIDGEWGSCRSPERIEDDGDWSDEIYAVRKAIAEATGDQ